MATTRQEEDEHISCWPIEVKKLVIWSRDDMWLVDANRVSGFAS